MEEILLKDYKRLILEKIYLNIRKKFTVIYNYYVIYLSTFLYSLNEKEIRKNLLAYLKEYKQTINDENKILFLLFKCLEKIESEDRIDEVLDQLFERNKETFVAYNSLLNEYLEGMETNHMDYVRFKRNIKCNQIDEEVKQNYLNKIIGYTLTREDVEHYFHEITEKKNESFDFATFFTYVKNHSKVFKDMNKEEMEELSGIFFKEEDEILKEFRLFLPAVQDLKSAMIVLHELSHAYDAYTYLGKKYKAKNEEEKAKTYEKKFIDEYILPKTR